MTLVTRCTACSTTFRVQPAQLSLRGGKVRCGKCHAVFDGLAALVGNTDAAAEIGPSPQLALFDPARLEKEAAEQVTLSEAAETATATDAVALIDDAVPETASKQPASNASPALHPSGPETEPAPTFLADPAPRPRFNIVWGLLALLAFVGLFSQAAIQYRTEAALLVPELRPYLEFACEQLGCEVRLPRRPELMSIESSDLQSDPQREQVIQLTAVIRNRAPFPQEFPALEVTLTNEIDRATVRRVLMPPEYLGAAGGESLTRGIGPGAEAVLRVDFVTTPDVRATGYRLYLFYP